MIMSICFKLVGVALQRSICIGFSESACVRCPGKRVPQRLQLYYCYSKINQGHSIWPLFGGCPLLRESIELDLEVSL